MNPLVPAPALPAPIQFAAPAAMKPNPMMSPQNMAILQAALKNRPPVNPLAGMFNQPVNPGSPPPAGDPAYVPGGQGPMAGGAAVPQVGLLAQLLGGGGGGAMMPGGLGGW